MYLSILSGGTVEQHGERSPGGIEPPPSRTSEDPGLFGPVAQQCGRGRLTCEYSTVLYTGLLVARARTQGGLERWRCKLCVDGDVAPLCAQRLGRHDERTLGPSQFGYARVDPRHGSNSEDTEAKTHTKTHTQGADTLYTVAPWH